LTPPNHANPAMEQNAQNYNHGHYASELNAEQFGEMLDVYDKNHSHYLSSINVPAPVEMTQKIKAQKKKANKTAQKVTEEEKIEPGLKECCGFLNNLIKLLPRT